MPRYKKELTLENLPNLGAREAEEREKELKELAARDIEGAKKEKNGKKTVQATEAGAEEIEAEKAIEERIKEAQVKEAEHKKSAAERKKLREELGISKKPETGKKEKAWAEELKAKVRAGAERVGAKKKTAEEEPREKASVKAEIETPGVQLEKFDKNFSSLEQKWFKRGEEISANPEKFVEEYDEILGRMTIKEKVGLNNELKAADLDYYRNEINKLASGEKKKDLGGEYVGIRMDLENTMSEINKIARELNEKYGYNIGKGGWLKKFSAKRKLDPVESEEFNILVFEYNALKKYYDKESKNFRKKFGSVVESVESGQVLTLTMRGININPKKLPGVRGR